VLRQLPGHAFTTFFSWMPDSRRVMLSSLSASGGTAPQIFLADTRGSALQQLTANPDGVTTPTVSPDGQTALFARSTGNFDVDSVRLSDAVVSPLLANGADNAMPSWALRQPALIYVNGLSGGGQQVWLRTVDSAGAPQDRPLPDLAPKGSIVLAPTLSPNADRVLYSLFGANTGSVRLFIASTSGGSPVRFSNTNNLLEVAPAWSPDGTQAAFITVHGVTADLRVAPSSGQAPSRILRADVNSLIPTWSPDGRWIAYKTGDDATLHLISPDGKTDRNLGPLDTPAVAFSADSKLLYGISSPPHHNYLFELDLATGRQRRIGDIGEDFTPKSESNPSLRFTLTPDGKSLTYSTARRISSLWMMTNFAPAPRGAAWLRALLHLP
ncbi:MAG: hypothetical protein ACRD1E_05360, partial [Terriglobales bacterium]